MEAYISAAGKSPGTSESLWGQILAYLGVGLLTIGTTLVLWGYFGGPVNYAPTGWLVTTAGQMLLFLGVVTLVSGGMQQTTHEVSQRVTYLGEHMLRIEEATQEVLAALISPALAAIRKAQRPSLTWMRQVSSTNPTRSSEIRRPMPSCNHRRPQVDRDMQPEAKPE